MPLPAASGFTKMRPHEFDFARRRALPQCTECTYLPQKAEGLAHTQPLNRNAQCL